MNEQFEILWLFVVKFLRYLIYKSTQTSCDIEESENPCRFFGSLYLGKSAKNPTWIFRFIMLQLICVFLYNRYYTMVHKRKTGIKKHQNYNIKLVLQTYWSINGKIYGPISVKFKLFSFCSSFLVFRLCSNVHFQSMFFLEIKH